MYKHDMFASHSIGMTTAGIPTKTPGNFKSQVVASCRSVVISLASEMVVGGAQNPRLNLSRVPLLPEKGTVLACILEWQPCGFGSGFIWGVYSSKVSRIAESLFVDPGEERIIAATDGVLLHLGVFSNMALLACLCFSCLFDTRYRWTEPEILNRNP